MEARVLSLDDVLRERQRWCVPVYQRHYAWDIGDDGQLTRLWEDIQEKADALLGGSIDYPHYIGAIIVAEPPNQPFGTVRQRLLVDGQQRITTFQLVLAALRETAREQNIDKLIPVIDAYLFNEVSGGMTQPKVERYKLWPSSFDRKLYQDIADIHRIAMPPLYPQSFYKNGNLKTGSAPRLLSAYWYLADKIREFMSDDGREADPSKRLSAILGGFLTGFRVVVIQLDDKDDAQEIFASLNGLGKPLTAIDLIRNDVFYRARRAGEDDEAIFEEYWKTLEDPFWEVITRQGRFNKARIDFFLGHLLVAETGKEVNLGKLAAEYQNYARKREFLSVAAEIGHILRYVPTYRALIQSGQPHLADDIAGFLKIWDLTTFYPLVFYVAVQNISDDEKTRIFALVKAYVVRRDLCGLTSKNYNNVVLRCLQRLRQKGPSGANLLDLFNEMEGDATRFPADAEVLQRFSQRKVYNDLPTPRLRYILEAIEHRKRTAFDESIMATVTPTIEHVMPQHWAEKWPLPDGRSAPTESALSALTVYKVDATMQDQISTREQLVDSIGNLTLVTSALNPSLGNESFEDKKVQLSASLLVLNREIGAHELWNEDEIRKRGIALAELTTQIWPAQLALDSEIQ